MHARSPKLLEDIRDAAAFIGEVTQGLTLPQYGADRLLRQAVERNFEIIGAHFGERDRRFRHRDRLGVDAGLRGEDCRFEVVMRG